MFCHARENPPNVAEGGIEIAEAIPHRGGFGDKRRSYEMPAPRFPPIAGHGTTTSKSNLGLFSSEVKSRRGDEVAEQTRRQYIAKTNVTIFVDDDPRGGSPIVRSLRGVFSSNSLHCVVDLGPSHLFQSYPPQVRPSAAAAHPQIEAVRGVASSVCTGSTVVVRVRVRVPCAKGALGSRPWILNAR
jgi:hypothetical protein